MRFISGQALELWLVLFAVVCGLICATSSGRLTSISFWLGLLALLLSLLLSGLEQVYLNK